MSIVHMDKIWVEIAKKFEMRTSGGRGGSLVISDTPGRGGGGGGSKKSKFLRTSFMDGPLVPPGLALYLFVVVKACQATQKTLLTNCPTTVGML